MKICIFGLLCLMGCQSEEQIRAMVWRGETHEIVRDLSTGQVEFLATDDPKFKNYVCVSKSDMEKLVRAARKELGRGRR